MNEITNNMKLWKKIDDNSIIMKLLEKFKLAFIHEDINKAYSCFDKLNFKQHQGWTLEEYINYEMEEFKLKCRSFGLSEDAKISAYFLDKNTIYFAFGKKEDCALFEATWNLNEDNNLLIGNNSLFRWEPKLQSIKRIRDEKKSSADENNYTLSYKRILNIKSPKNIFCDWLCPRKKEISNTQLYSFSLESHLGGSFQSLLWDEGSNIEDLNSYWLTLRTRANNTIFLQDVMMRGKNHPLFEDDQFPKVNFLNSTIEIDKLSIIPVILYIKFANDQEMYIKYPKERYWHFKEKIVSVCLTDNLSYDWIVTLK